MAGNRQTFLLKMSKNVNARRYKIARCWSPSLAILRDVQASARKGAFTTDSNETFILFCLELMETETNKSASSQILKSVMFILIPKSASSFYTCCNSTCFYFKFDSLQLIDISDSASLKNHWT
jgi:hypothetical protein